MVDFDIESLPVATDPTPVLDGLTLGENEGATSVFVYDVEVHTATRRITFEGTQGWPVWSQDGQIMFPSK